MVVQLSIAFHRRPVCFIAPVALRRKSGEFMFIVHAENLIALSLTCGVGRYPLTSVSMLHSET